MYTQGHKNTQLLGVAQRLPPFAAGPCQLTWKDSYDLFHLLLESNLEDTICFVNDETVEVFVHESWSILEEEAGRGRGREREGEGKGGRGRGRGRGRGGGKMVHIHT